MKPISDALARTDARTCGDGCTYLRERLLVLAWRMQCTARTDAVHCRGGCSALRLRWVKLAPKSPVLCLHTFLGLSFHGMISSFHGMIPSFHAVLGLRHRDKSAKVIDYNDQRIRVREYLLFLGIPHVFLLSHKNCGWVDIVRFQHL